MINQLTFLIIKRMDYFSNAYITYKIMLTILVSVGSDKRNFSHIKIIKNLFKFNNVSKKIK